MVKKDLFNKICNTARTQTLNIPSVHSSAQGTLSFGIVNSEGNGKRLSFSKALLAVLEIDKDIALLIVPSESVVLVARELPFPNTFSGKLGKNGKWYNSTAVKSITSAFGIDFGKHVSYAYNNIDINDLDGVPVATIHIPNANNTGDVA